MYTILPIENRDSSHKLLEHMLSRRAPPGSPRGLIDGRNRAVTRCRRASLPGLDLRGKRTEMEIEMEGRRQWIGEEEARVGACLRSPPLAVARQQ